MLVFPELGNYWPFAPVECEKCMCDFPPIIIVPPGRRNMEVYNLFDRVSRLVRSNVTSLVQSLEDPEKIIEQAVKDMQSDLIKVCVRMRLL